METSLRLVLILIALLIVAGIVWDTIRARKGSFKRKPFPSKLQSAELERIDDIHDTFDEQAKEELLMTFPTPEVSLESSVTDKPSISFDPTTIVILNVLARQPGVFSGKKLIDVFKDAHLFYGDMDIYHRYENTDGTGKIMFSIVSAVEPGIFDLTKMDTFVTPGLTLFFSSLRPNQSIAAFELMLRTAKLIALRLDGELKDQDRRPLTLQGIEKYREKIRVPQLLRARN